MEHHPGIARIARRARAAVLSAVVSLATIPLAIAGPDVSLSRTQVDFGRIPRMYRSSVQPVFVTNTGDAPLTVQALTITGTHAAEFGLGGTCVAPITLAPAARCRIELTVFVSGIQPATRSATLNVLSDGASPSHAVQLKATLDAAEAYLGPPDPDPDWIDFAPQPVGIDAPAATLNIDNHSGLDFTLTSIALVGGNAADFSLSSPCQTSGAFATGTRCAFTVGFAPGALGPRSTELRLVLTVFGVGGMFSYSITGVGGVASPPPPAAANYQGLWWASPAGSESGWGINFAHQGDVIFATWFTYDIDGNPTWFVALLNKTAEGVYAGDVFAVTGVPFDSTPWDTSKVAETPVGTMTVTFADATHASLAYTVNGVSQTKPITPQVFADPVPSCAWGLESNLALATNYQDLWWAAPAGSESGWGANFTQQGDVIFVTWFTYGADGKATWFVAVVDKQADKVYSGPAYTVIGNPFNAVPWDPTKQVESGVGTVTLTFTDGNHATFHYTIEGVTQSKQIERQVFVSPGTVCR